MVGHRPGGRKKGSANRKPTALSFHSARAVRSHRLESRVTAAFVKWIDIAAEREKKSRADILHIAFKEYMMGRYWLQGPDYAAMQDEL